MVTKELAISNVTKINPPFPDLLKQYRWSLEAANKSPATVIWYLDILNRFFSFLDASKLNKPINQLGREALRAYITHLQNVTRWAGSKHINKDKGKLAPYSIQGHVRAIKAFYGWLKSEGYIDGNPLEKYPLPKVPQLIIKTLSADQINKLLKELDRHTPIGAKYYAMIILLLDTGLRIGEIVRIRMSDIDLMNCSIRVMGKGQKERILPFCWQTRKELLHYVKLFRTRLTSQESEYLFPASDGNHISINSVQQFLRRLAVKSGLEGIRCSPHIFRHTFATESIAHEANVFALKDIMGHSSLQTTLKYTHLNTNDLRAQHAKFSPVANLLKEKYRAK